MGLAIFLYGGLHQVWYLIVSIPDICLLSYFYQKHFNNTLPVDPEIVDVELDEGDVEELRALLVAVEGDPVVYIAVEDDFCVELDEAGMDVLDDVVVLIKDVVELGGDVVVTVGVVEDLIVELDVVVEPAVVLGVDNEPVVKGLVEVVVNNVVLVVVGEVLEVVGVAVVVDDTAGEDEAVVDC